HADRRADQAQGRGEEITPAFVDGSRNVDGRDTKRSRAMRTLATAALLACALAARAADKDVPIEATLKAVTDSYTLDLGGKTADDFRKALEAAEKTGDYPEAPKVDLVLELKNTSDKEVKVKVGGTTTVLELGLNGPAAVTVQMKRRVTPKIVVAPKEVVLA